MASVVEICNRALQKLGAKRITSLTQDSANARACNVAYIPTRDRVLRDHQWNCAIARAELAADATAPAWGRENSFQLPSDFLGLADDYPEDNHNAKDWQIEGRKILTNDDAPLRIRYIKTMDDPNEMDACLREVLACELAIELCEEITQSNTKKQLLDGDREKAIRAAKKVNAIENVSKVPPEDDWITKRA